MPSVFERWHRTLLPVVLPILLVELGRDRMVLAVLAVPATGLGRALPEAGSWGLLRGAARCLGLALRAAAEARGLGLAAGAAGAVDRTDCSGKSSYLLHDKPRRSKLLLSFCQSSD